MTTAASPNLFSGDRVPNFALPNTQEQTLLFYEYAVGRPVVFWATSEAFEPHPETLANVARSIESNDDLQHIVLVDSFGTWPDLKSLSRPSVVQVLADEEGRVRKAIFGQLPSEERVGLMVTDRDLRILEGGLVPWSVNELVEAVDALSEEARQDGRSLSGRAPVLEVPRILSPELCEQLIARFDEFGPEKSPMPTGDAAGAGLEVRAEHKRREDVFIQDEALDTEVVQSIARRVLPEVHKAFCFQASHFERLKLVRYGADGQGYFHAHRDNTAPDTAHRQFALTLNLNSARYDGGELYFPEYGNGSLYSPPAGAGVVFSCSLAHAVRPVVRGTRYAVITFMHRGPEDTPPDAQPDS